ncbi:MAG: tetratricopeptide repeat protein [Isosphaeraceae bacterium]|nr:tetratricopeptide repeat protein [Isosphaeraceae bacterium]
MSSSDHATAQSLVEEGKEHYRLQRPLAAWASWRRALGFVPDFAPAVQALQGLERAQQLPAAARTALRFEPPGSPIRRKRWDKLFKARDLDDLSDASEAFATLAEQDPDDDAARYNLAVCLAWLGRNQDAVETFRQVVCLRAGAKFEQAVAAWTLAEVLRHGTGAEALADDRAYAWTLECDDATVDSWVASCPGLHPVAAPAGASAGPRAFTWLDRPMPPAGPKLEVGDVPRVLAQVLKFPGCLRLSSPDSAMLDHVYGEVTSALGERVRPVRRESVPLPLPLLDAALWNFRLPADIEGEDEHRLRRAAVEHYYEDVWIHEPRHALDGVSPLVAARVALGGNAIMRAQLTAVVRFREQLGERAWTANLYQGYPFDRLRRRLGLDPSDAETVDPADTSCMSEDGLDRLVLADLDDARLTEAYESAAALRIDRLSARYASELTRRNARSLGRLDTPALVAPLVREALSAGHADEALHWLDQARSFNSGRDRRTFDVWSAEIRARSGDPEGAVDLYQRLLAHDPENARLALDAAETLLDNGYVNHARPLLDRAQQIAGRQDDSALVERARSLLEAAAG